jgi:hypothetical protein
VDKNTPKIYINYLVLDHIYWEEYGFEPLYFNSFTSYQIVTEILITVEGKNTKKFKTEARLSNFYSVEI